MTEQPDVFDEDELPPLVVTSFDRLEFLVIARDPATLGFTERLLKAAAAKEVRTASSAFTAVGLLTVKSAQTDCIICDNDLEGMSGLALLKRIRAGRNAVIPRNIRFILLTDNPHRDLVRSAIDLDVSGLITKPASPDSILKAMHMAFSRVPRLKKVDDYAQLPLHA